MASPAQTAANQANAKLSTGTRTHEGKARSARNATSHGLTAADVIVFPGEEQASDLRDGLAQDLRPAASPLADLRVTPDISKEYERMNRYLRHHNSGYNRCFRDLRIAQTELAARLAVSIETARALPPLALISELKTNRKARHSPAGFARPHRHLRPPRP